MPPRRAYRGSSHAVVGEIAFQSTLMYCDMIFAEEAIKLQLSIGIVEEDRLDLS